MFVVFDCFQHLRFVLLFSTKVAFVVIFLFPFLPVTCFDIFFPVFFSYFLFFDFFGSVLLDTWFSSLA